jgi:hypothetical protein
MLAALRPNLSNEETQELDELITEYEDVYATENSDYGWTECTTYRHWSRPDSSATHEYAPLGKTGKVGVMLEDVQQRRVIEESHSP